jgi:hypothetical protein
VPVSVVIDDYIAVDQNNKMNSSFMNITKDKELWPVLLEKAIVKLRGNYNSIQGGWMEDSGYSLTGWWGETHDHAKVSDQQLWNELEKQDGKRAII